MVTKLTLLMLGMLILPNQLFTQEIPRRYPHNGDIYQATGYADSYFKWLNIGGWVGKNGSIPGFELDYAVDSSYYSYCTSYTTLPQGYDDCETAGIEENDPDTVAFGVGSYDARQISAGTDYFAQWSLGGGTTSVGAYAVNWSETWNFVNLGYGPRSPWYIDSVAGGVLTSYVAIATQTQQRNWRWRDHSITSANSSRQEPDGGYYYSGGSLRHTGTLRGPAGSDFDLYLFYWNGSAWTQVASSSSTSSNETINYTGSPGYYAWAVYAYSGTGRYQLGMEFNP
jgi:hypothetical protein